MDGDADKLFAYNTRQEINIQDSRLGWTNFCLQLAILIYIVFGIFVYGQGYLDFEQARGAIATHVKGDVVAVSIAKPGTRYFSAEEITYPGLENGNVFVATRQKVMRQKRGVCEDYTMPCATDADCTAAVGGSCSRQGFCLEAAWCAVEPTPEIYELEVGDLFIWVKSSIQFVRLAPDKIYSTEQHHPYPVRGVNLFSVRDLLMMCMPVPVRYEEISELGAAVEVQFIWSCDVALDDCKPQLNARRLDVLFDPQHIGYAFSYAEHVSEEERVLNEMRGVRLFLRTYGTARKTSVTDLIMKASTTWTLLGLAPIITDLLMLKALKKWKKYFARKYEESPNFDEYMKQLHEMQDQTGPSGGTEAEDPITQLREEVWQRRLNEED